MCLPVTYSILSALITGATGYAHINNNQEIPAISTISTIYENPSKEGVTMACETQNIGSYVVLWKKDQEVLTAGDMIVKPDPRISLVDFNLRIKDLEAGDAGQYTCYVSTNGPTISVTHNLQILVPALVRAEPSGGNYVVKKGQRVKLNCAATGNPTPQMEWSRQGGRLPSEEDTTHGESLVIHSIAKADQGVYVCTASNGVGQPSSDRINLQVLYPPEIELETNKVHSGENKEAHLTCIVKGNPTPLVRWYKETTLLSESSSVIFSTSDADRYTLVLRSVRSGMDFGNYSCVAENSMGTFKKHIEVHGRPTSPIFRSKPNSSQNNKFLLTWSVDSYSPIGEHRLLYRKIKPYHGPINSSYPMGEGDWTNVIIPGDTGHKGFTHLRSYQVSGLHENAEYECLVQARNQFGWSEPSRLHTFFTSREDPVVHFEWKKALSSGNWLQDSYSTLLLLLYFYFIH